MRVDKALKTALEIAKVSQNKLSKELNYDQRTLNRLLNHSSNMETKTILRILGAIDGELIIRINNKEVKITSEG